MPLIECLLGEAETTIAGTTYLFQRDKHGRFVSNVERQEDVACLISVDPYRIAEEIADDVDTGTDADAKKAGGKKKGPTKKAAPEKTETPEPAKDETDPSGDEDDKGKQDANAPEPLKVTPDELRNIAAQVIAGDLAAPEGETVEGYAKQLNDAADELEANLKMSTNPEAPKAEEPAEKPKTQRKAASKPRQPRKAKAQAAEKAEG
jgi:hypothetical protein